MKTTKATFTLNVRYLVLALHVSPAGQVGEENAELVSAQEPTGQRLCRSPEPEQHCFICRPSDSDVPTDAGIEPRTVATDALAVRRSNH